MPLRGTGSAGIGGTRRCGLPSLSPARPAAAVPCGGARLFWSPAYPAFSFVLAPLPRRGRIAPLPPVPAGRGETKVIFMQGAPPLASPGLNPRGTGSTCRCGSRRGGCVLPRLFFLPYNRFFAPIPPPPLPSGKGETSTLFRRGLPPPAPRELDRLRHLQNLPSRCPAADSGRHHLRETDSCRFCGEPWVQPRGCRGRSPRRNKLLVSPFPTGEGGRGDRGQKEN